ncbi:glycosyltransferase [Escherichia coli]|uniref:glycosyltransferase family 2 protein n=1 Tax=Escherichia coli TaxID=562 RepID=UPI0017BD2B3D|nr:glycosyltransferase family 2 protein [Escherichia coli]EFH9192605.1 glycosyltransferase [Escherichia coli]MDA5351265.1 glycosyltransferase family 2 protein [Escherichia coli]
MLIYVNFLELSVLSLIIPVYKNEASIPDLLSVISEMNKKLDGLFEAVFVVDGSPDRCYPILRELLPKQSFRSQLVLHSKNFGSFIAVRTGLEYGQGERFAVMAADLQEPPEMILEMNEVLLTPDTDVVIGTREGRKDPGLSSLFSNLFWSLYRRWVISDIPSGGVDMFACSRKFRDVLLTLEEKNSSLIAQVFWLGFNRKTVTYERQERRHGKSAWTFRKKLTYLMDSIFSFTDLPVRFLIYIGVTGSLLAGLLGMIVLLARLTGLIDVQGYSMTMITICFFSCLNLLGLGVVGSYAWRGYENSKQRPVSISVKADVFGENNETTP